MQEEGKKVFQTICNMLDARQWKYRADEEKLAVDFGVTGEDLPMRMAFRIDEENQLVRLISPIMNIPEEKRAEVAVLICAINYMITDGKIEYDIRDGELLYSATVCYRGSQLGAELFDYMLRMACLIVDEYNDKLLLYCKGKLSFDSFMEDIFTI